MRRAIPLLMFLAACDVSWGPELAPSVTVSPAPGPFNDTLEVTLTLDQPGLLYVTTDGSDPLVESELRIVSSAPVKVTLARTSTVKWVSEGPELKSRSDTLSGEYVRAGGKPGTISGVIVTGDVIVGHGVQLSLDGDAQEFEAPTEPSRIPFSYTGVADGEHALQAIADRDDDGNFLPFLDINSAVANVVIDRKDPFKASVEDLVIYLGASASDKCTIFGNVTLADPQTTALVNLSALSPEALTGAIGGGGGGGDPTGIFGGLLGTLLGGDRLLADGSTGRYPYVLADLEPGTYIPVPALISFDRGLGINLIANILNPVDCGPGDVKRADFRFGPVTLSGRVTITPATPGGGGGDPLGGLFNLGTVAARSSTLGTGVQAVLMPAFLSAAGTDGTLAGDYEGKGIRDFANVSLRVFSGSGGGLGGGLPGGGFGLGSLLEALVWAVNPLSSDPPDARVQTQAGPLTQDLAVTR